MRTLTPLILALALGCRAPDADGDGFGEDVDCDESSADVHPDATETCNGVDDDCNGTIDDAADAPSWYADADGDGYGDAADATPACDAPAATVADGTDCDDADPAVHPGASETDCTDPTDYNCDGSTGFSDADGDGTPACEDCDDTDAAILPGATEVCNGEDDDCDALIDDADDGIDPSTQTTTWADADADGYGDAAAATTACEAPTGNVADATDCDDANAQVSPGATEVCNDGIDDDCDGTADGDDASGKTTWYADADADGAGDPASSTESCAAPTGAVSNADDCDDTDADLNPTTSWYADADTDGFGDAGSTKQQCEQPEGWLRDATDCDDTSATTNPDATEACNTKDDDCDGETDEAGATGESTFYADADADTYGDPASSVQACAAPTGHVSDASDCDDTDADLNPETTWYADADADGFGDPSATKTQCAAPGGHARVADDCDDAAAEVHPGADEQCADIDANCDGDVDFDADGDDRSDRACGGTDCRDDDATITDCGLSKETAKVDCAEILSIDPTLPTGRYWIDPDGDDDHSDAVQVRCDMKTAGGGWTVVYFVDAAHFDAMYANDTKANAKAPLGLNVQKDVWNVPAELLVAETLFACTDDAKKLSWWRYDKAGPYDFFANTTTSYDYQYGYPSKQSNGEAAGCLSTHKQGIHTGYGFMVLEAGSSCGNCSAMLWGNYHYPAGRADCNNTDTPTETHASPNDSRTIGYPLCARKQTSTGTFWIAVR